MSCFRFISELSLGFEKEGIRVGSPDVEVTVGLKLIFCPFSLRSRYVVIHLGYTTPSS